MSFCEITFSSKKKNFFIKFFPFFLTKNKYLNNNNKYKNKKTKTHITTLLKSPHVNKSAQEHFEIRFYSKTLKITNNKKMKYIYFLKNLIQNRFSNLKIKIKFSIQKKLIETVKVFTSIKANITKQITKQINRTNLNRIQFQLTKLKYYFKAFDIQGELKLYNV